LPSISDSCRNRLGTTYWQRIPWLHSFTTTGKHYFFNICLQKKKVMKLNIDADAVCIICWRFRVKCLIRRCLAIPVSRYRYCCSMKTLLKILIKKEHI
jgi:hypothetical protein